MTHTTISPPLRRFLPYLLILILIPLLGCNLLNRLTGESEPMEEELPMSVEEALEAEPLDSRPTVLEEMGPPDAFTITFSELEGQPVRWESWSYFDLDAQLDFIDGELLWAVNLEPIADGSFFAHWYDPLAFRAGMSPAEVSALLPDVLLTEIDTSALEIEGSLALAGEQILFGFDSDRLVYVETFILSPDPDGEPLPAAAAQTSEADPEDGGDPIVFEDDFESDQPQAVQLFTDVSMEFGNIDGKGALTTHYPQGLMPAYYDSPVLADFILEVEIQPLSLAQGAKAGILFRGDNPVDGVDYYYLLSIQPSDQQLVFEAWHGGKWVQIGSAAIPADLVPKFGVYKLKLDCQGSSIRVYLGGSLAAEFSSDLIPDPGSIALTLLSSRDPDTVLFDNLLITSSPDAGGAP